MNFDDFMNQENFISNFNSSLSYNYSYENTPLLEEDVDNNNISKYGNIYNFNNFEDKNELHKSFGKSNSKLIDINELINNYTTDINSGTNNQINQITNLNAENFNYSDNREQFQFSNESEKINFSEDEFKGRNTNFLGIKRNNNNNDSEFLNKLESLNLFDLDSLERLNASLINDLENLDIFEINKEKLESLNLFDLDSLERLNASLINDLENLDIFEINKEKSEIKKYSGQSIFAHQNFERFKENSIIDQYKYEELKDFYEQNLSLNEDDWIGKQEKYPIFLIEKKKKSKGIEDSRKFADDSINKKIKIDFLNCISNCTGFHLFNKTSKEKVSIQENKELNKMKIVNVLDKAIEEKFGNDVNSYNNLRMAIIKKLKSKNISIDITFEEFYKTYYLNSEELKTKLEKIKQKENPIYLKKYIRCVKTYLSYFEEKKANRRLR